MLQLVWPIPQLWTKKFHDLIPGEQLGQHQPHEQLPRDVSAPAAVVAVAFVVVVVAAAAAAAVAYVAVAGVVSPLPPVPTSPE